MSNFEDGLTRRLLLLVASDRTGDSIEFSLDTVGRALDVAFSFSSADLSLALSVFLLAALRPRGSTSRVADSLDDSTLDGVVSKGSRQFSSDVERVII